VKFPLDIRITDMVICLISRSRQAMLSQAHPTNPSLQIRECGPFGNYDIPVMTRNCHFGTSRSGNVSESEKLADISSICGSVTIITSETGSV
jgi:hypothetical protein